MGKSCLSRGKNALSRKIYSTSDEKKGRAPVADFGAFKSDLEIVNGEVEGLNAIGKFKELYNI